VSYRSRAIRLILGFGLAGLFIALPGTATAVGPNVDFGTVVSVNEGQIFTLSGTLSVLTKSETYELALDWSDPNNTAGSTFDLPQADSLGTNDTFNSSTDSAVLTLTSVTIGDYVTANFSVDYQYRDDGASPGNGTAQDAATITASLTPGSGLSAELTVNNVTPTISYLSTIAALVGQSVSLSGTFGDPGVLDEFQVLVDWGDGGTSTFAVSSLSALTIGNTFASSTDAAVLTVTDVDLVTSEITFTAGSHQYASADSYTVDVTVTDDDTGLDGQSTTADIETSSIEVRKFLFPSYDPGRFDLLIDDVAKAEGVGHNGTTGPVAVHADFHTVSETAVSPSHAYNYRTTVVCQDQNTRSFVGYGYSTNLTIDVGVGDAVICTFINQRISSWFWWR
jgi:hypothetical protein